MNRNGIFRQKSFRNFFWGRFFLFLGIHMQMNTLSLQVYYQYTHDELMLGITGLCEAIPFIMSALYMGHLADRYNKKNLVSVAITALVVLMIGFTLFSISLPVEPSSAYPILAGICLFGLIRALFATSLQALLPQIISREWYEKASAWNSSAWHVALVSGPLLSTFLFLGNNGQYLPFRAYIASALCYGMALIFFRNIPYEYHPSENRNFNVREVHKEMLKAIRFVSKEKNMLGALMLDMLAVLFGGATAILPAYVDKVLHVSEAYVAYLRMAPAFGAMAMGLFLTRISLAEKAGRYLLISVLAFGLFTLGFAYSEHFIPAFIFLVLTGAVDNISIVIRHTLLQVMTPNDLRGKVSAINSIFIGSSNEIGAFESGLAARLMGIKPSLFFGGIMTLFSVVFIFVRFRTLYRLNLKECIERK